MLWMGPTGVGLGVDRLDAHESHQALDAFAVDLTTLSAEVPRHGSAAVGGHLQVLLIDQTHQLQILGADRNRHVIKRGPAHAQ